MVEKINKEIKDLKELKKKINIIISNNIDDIEKKEKILNFNSSNKIYFILLDELKSGYSNIWNDINLSDNSFSLILKSKEENITPPYNEIADIIVISNKPFCVSSNYVDDTLNCFKEKKLQIKGKLIDLKTLSNQLILFDFSNHQNSFIKKSFELEEIKNGMEEN